MFQYQHIAPIRINKDFVKQLKAFKLNVVCMAPQRLLKTKIAVK